MAATTPHQQPTPERFFNTINAYEQTEAMKTAVELELFTAIAEGNQTAETIAKRCNAASRGVRILCDFLTIHAPVAQKQHANCHCDTLEACGQAIFEKGVSGVQGPSLRVVRASATKEASLIRAMRVIA